MNKGMVVVRRIVSIVPTMLIASILVFGLVQLIPGDPAATLAGEGASQETIAAYRSELGLDRPLVAQYLSWLVGVLHGNLGTSLISGEPVVQAIGRTLPITCALVALALIFAILLGVPGGVVAAWYARRVPDRIVSTISSVGVAMPSFWLGLILVSWLALQLRILPAAGFVPLSQDPLQSLLHLILPAFAMAVVGAAEIARQLRSAMITSLASDSVRTLYAKGLGRRQVIGHALKNSSVPLLTIVGLQVNRFLGATVVIESIFGLGGLGQLIITATLQKDFVVVQGVVLITAFAVIVTNILVDLCYLLVDPRIR